MSQLCKEPFKRETNAVVIKAKSLVINLNVLSSNMLILFYMGCALLVLICLWVLHYLHHFRCHLAKRTISSPRMNSLPAPSHIWCFLLSSVDGEEFDIFPMSFLLYLTLLIIIHILFFLCESNYIHSFHMHVIMMDYVLVCVILIVSIWVSLFSYYRYHTTLMSITLQSVSSRELLYKFPVYAVPFGLLFLFQIYVFYWIFPLVVIIFGAFNIYCTYHASAMLIQQYKSFIEQTDSFSVTFNMNNDLLKSIVFTKRISLLCCVLHSMDLAVFNVVYKHYNINIMCYISVSWCISALLFSLNFIRNLSFWKRFSSLCKTPIITRSKCEPMNHNKPPSSIQIHALAPTQSDIISAPKCVDTVHEDHYHSMGDAGADHLGFRALDIISKSLDITHTNKLHSRPLVQQALTQHVVRDSKDDDDLPHVVERSSENTPKIIRKIRVTQVLELLDSEKMTKSPSSTRLSSSTPEGMSLCESDDESTPEVNVCVQVVAPPVSKLRLVVTPAENGFDGEMPTMKANHEVQQRMEIVDDKKNSFQFQRHSCVRNDKHKMLAVLKQKKQAQSVPALMHTATQPTPFHILARFGFCTSDQINSVNECNLSMQQKRSQQSVKKKIEDAHSLSPQPLFFESVNI
eukprot:245037_1